MDVENIFPFTTTATANTMFLPYCTAALVIIVHGPFCPAKGSKLISLSPPPYPSPYRPFHCMHHIQPMSIKIKIKKTKLQGESHNLKKNARKLTRNHDSPHIQKLKGAE